MPYFWYSNWHNFWLYFGKSCKATLVRKPTGVSQITPTFISVGLPISKWRPFKNMKFFCFFDGSFFKIKIGEIFYFQWIKYLGKDLSYFKNWGIEVNYCWNYGPSNLLLHFTEYRLDQLNNMKIAVNSTIQNLESCSHKKCLLKIFWSTHHKMTTL